MPRIFRSHNRPLLDNFAVPCMALVASEFASSGEHADRIAYYKKIEHNQIV